MDSYTVYNGFAIIPDLRQNRNNKNLATFGHIFPVNISMYLFNFFTKKIGFLSPLVFPKIALQMYREILKKYKKGNHSFFKYLQKATLCQSVPIGFEMAKKKGEQTNKHFRIYIRRDRPNRILMISCTVNTLKRPYKLLIGNFNRSKPIFII